VDEANSEGSHTSAVVTDEESTLLGDDVHVAAETVDDYSGKAPGQP